MSKADRQAKVEALTATLTASPNLYLTDFSGLTVEHLTDFRRRLRQVGARYVVVKNTLARRAVEAGRLAAVDTALLRGPTGIVLAGPDPLAAAKVITEFAKTHEKPAVKAGVVDGRAVEAVYVKRLGELPSRPVLLGQLLGAFNGILAQLAGALEALRAQRAEPAAS
jgi:large subunit ribosomal protein L10